MEIGEKIRKARENNEYSREYLAAILNLDKRTIEKIETNQRDIHWQEIKKISEVLEITPQELLFGEPRLIFENCHPQHGSSVYHTGEVHYQPQYELNNANELILALKQTIRDKEEIISLKDAVIAELTHSSQ